MEKYLEVAIDAVKRAGEFLLKNFGSITLCHAEEKKANDFVSFVDRESERIIKERILSAFPDHKFLGEEEGGDLKCQGWLWIVDPLDGTKNFLHGIDAFSISCALLKDKDVKLGVVYLPAKGIIYAAQKGNGAFKNGKRIKVDNHQRIDLSLFATAFPFREKSKFEILAKIFGDLYLKFSDVRRIGSAAYDLCLTAEGVFSVFYEYGLSPWDIAAGSIIVEEAGGVVKDFEGGIGFLKTGNIVAGRSDAVDVVLDVIKKYWK
ncbi:MAG: inositol monophosphatase family protein [candidate division WOR-3 bacterium]